MKIKYLLSAIPAALFATSASADISVSGSGTVDILMLVVTLQAPWVVAYHSQCQLLLMAV